LTVFETHGSSDEQAEEFIPEQAGKRQIRIGVFVLAGLISTIYLLFLLTDPALFRGRYLITTTVDNVMGLRAGDPVQMRGVTIGRVHDFEMASDDENVDITLEVDGQWIILEGSTTQLVSPGLMAPKTVEVLPGSGPGTIGRGGSLPGVAVKGLLDDTESLGEMGQVVLNRVTALLSPENLDAIGGSAQGLNSLLGELSEIVNAESGNLKDLIESLNAAAEGLQDVTAAGPELTEGLTTTIAKADSLMGRLNATSESVEVAMASLSTILGRIEGGEGTLGQLWASDSLHTSLVETSESARLLLDDLRENPGRYISVSIF
jgi:phospholipid/cholesterol/gamma-HCH transport system substrate-binding protein